MTSLNAVLMKFFKLPPAVRMVLAVAGFGSLATILYTLTPGLRTRRGQMWLLVIGGIGLLIYGLIWLARRYVFGKKASVLSGALESQGPTRGDIAEQEQIYREKFRAKLADLRANGLSVYKLPWFVLMGEPGCGKTASLIHSGLDFPLGKDEVPGFGGTRNYNWWFTNEAVILDTAGRIAFQEEGTTDKVEWEYFLKLLKQNRPRCPVNGVIIAVPADKLLRDSADERAQKASILRERLRQVHQALGVRFPTFVLATKMDLVGGFSEFFEEIRVDLQQRNQMFGWSRPGEFQAPYDPAGFGETFDQVYYRLRDWGMRYLQRKATEEELGLIVTFPEAFRQLREPLNDYIGAIFQKSPLLEPPFFRGFYFTSAVQEGAPIFDILARTHAGARVEGRKRPGVDSKAFFIHDFYARKVFPEHGLVFRSAKHVSLNRRMRRTVWMGSAALILLMLTFFGVGRAHVKNLVEGPRDHCGRAAAMIGQPVPFAQWPDNLRLAQALHADLQRYNQKWIGLYARLLFIGADPSVPRGYVRDIHARFVLDGLLKPILAEAGRKLRDYKPALASPPAEHAAYLAALQVYARWYAEMVGQHELKPLNEVEAEKRAADAEQLLAFLALGDKDRGDIRGQVQFAVAGLASPARYFAREILRDTLGFKADEATETVRQAVERLADRWRPITELGGSNTNVMVAYWSDFAEHVEKLRERYDELLKLPETLRDPARYGEAKDTLQRLTQGVEQLQTRTVTPTPGSLKEAYYNFDKFLADNGARIPQDNKRIVRLSELLGKLQARWETDFKPLEDALKVGAPKVDVNPQKQAYDALLKGRKDLETSLAASIGRVRDRLRLKPDQEPVSVYADQKLIEVREADPALGAFQGDVAIMLSPTALGTNAEVKSYVKDLRDLLGGEQPQQDLDDFSKWPALLAGIKSAVPPGERLPTWFEQFERMKAGGPADQIAAETSGFKDRPFWQPAELFKLAGTLWEARKTHAVNQLLGEMASRAEQAREPPGLARLMPDYRKPAASDVLPFDRHRFNEPKEKPVEPKPEQPEREDDLRRLGARPASQPAGPGQERIDAQSNALLAQYDTRVFLVRTLTQFEAVQSALQGMPGADRVVRALDNAANVYVDTYFTEWYELYNRPERLLSEPLLRLLQGCHEGKITWPQYVEFVTGEGKDLGAALARRAEALIRESILYEVGHELSDPVYTRLKSRVDQLPRSLPKDFNDSMRRPSNLPGRQEGDAWEVVAKQIAVGWDKYVERVRSLGPLTETAGRSAALPDLEAMLQDMVYKRATRREFALIAPLMDLAEYGQELLTHHLDRKLADIFAPHVGHYPVLRSSYGITQAADIAAGTVAPQDFRKLLRSAAEFKSRFETLYANLRPESSPTRKTLDHCVRWIEFLYNKDYVKALDDLRTDTPPRRLDDLRVALAEVPVIENLANAAFVYQQLRLTLPLTDESDRPLEIEAPTTVMQRVTVQDALHDDQRAKRCRFDLLAAERVQFPQVIVKLSELHPEAVGKYPQALDGWTLPGAPWTLLVLMAASDSKNLEQGMWDIPVRIRVRDLQTGRDVTVGFEIGIQIGQAHPFPVVITPPDPVDPQPPKMARARKYLPQ